MLNIIISDYYVHCIYVQWRIKRANQAMAPTEVGNDVWSPLGGRKNTDSIVNFSKCKDFGPLSLLSNGFGPIRRNATLKTQKRSITEKVIRKLGR